MKSLWIYWCLFKHPDHMYGKTNWTALWDSWDSWDTTSSLSTSDFFASYSPSYPLLSSYVWSLAVVYLCGMGYTYFYLISLLRHSGWSSLYSSLNIKYTVVQTQLVQFEHGSIYMHNMHYLKKAADVIICFILEGFLFNKILFYCSILHIVVVVRISTFWRLVMIIHNFSI